MFENALQSFKKRKTNLELIIVTVILIAIVFTYATDGKIGFSMQGTEPTPIEDGEYSKTYVDIVESENSIIIEIMPDSTPELKVNKFKIKLSSGKNTTAIVKNMQNRTEQELAITENEIEISPIISQDSLQASLDDKNKAILTVFEYQITFQNSVDINSVEIEMENTETGEILPNGFVYLAIAKIGSDYSKLQKQTKEEFLEMNPELIFNEKEGALHLVEGAYEIKENTIIPKELKIAIDAGVKIKIASEKSIVSYSDIDIQGTEENPVEISRLDLNNAFGVFGIIGNGTNSKTTIKNLQISGGSEHFINGIFFSGQLSVYHSDLELIDSTINKSSSDDGLNAKYGTVLINGTEFSANYGDQVDLDFCTGTIKDSTFQAKSENANGDGLDISGSTILVKESLFEGFKDKGISIGEESFAIIYNNMIEGNNMGSAVKDSSTAFFIKNTFKNNNIAIAAYQKKQVFNGANFYIYENTFEKNNDKIDLDKKSDYKNISFTAQELNSLETMTSQNNVLGLEKILKAKE